MDNATWIDDPTQLSLTVEHLRREHAARITLDKALLRLYYQRPVTPVGNIDQPYREIASFDSLQQLGFNLSREVIDASSAMICRPLQSKIVPVGADFETQRAAELLGRLSDGIDDSTDFLTKATRAYRDGCNTTIGPIKWFIDETTKEIQCENLDPLSVFWHYDEGTNPVHMYVQTPVPRAILRGRFPAMAGKIDQAPTWHPPTIVGVTPPGSRMGGDTVRVCEGWRRKLSDSVGKHVMAVDGAVLVSEPWDFDFHPIVSFRWSPDYLGYGGVPLGRIVAPYHIWSNQLVRQVWESLKGAVPWLLAHEDSLVDQASDVPYQLIKWGGPGGPPSVVAANPVPSQVIEEITALRVRAFAEGGVNSDAAAGTRPSGLNSAPSQNAWIDIASTRTINQQRAWEQLYKDSARVKVALASVAYKTKAARIKAPGSSLIEQIKFPNLKEDQYEVQFSLASGLALTFSGRLEQVDQLEKRGKINSAEATRLLGLPDIQATSDRVNAPQDLAEKQVSSALDECKFMMPSALQGMEGLDEVIRIGSLEYQRAMMSGIYPPENMECLRRLIKAAEARKPPAPMPVAPAPAPQPVAQA